MGRSAWLLPLLAITPVALAGETFVIAAGVERYEDERIAPLRYAVADARAVAAAFRAAGVAPDHVVVLSTNETEPARRPTRNAVLVALERVKEQATAEARLICFFAGHGEAEGGEQYLLTCDTRRSLVAETALPLRLVEKALDGIQAAEVLFLLDACRNDLDAGRADADAVLTEDFARGLRPRLAAESGRPAPRFVATLLACDIGQRAWEDPATGHGIFTACLLKALTGEAMGPGRAVQLSSLTAYVQREVERWCARRGREQRPRLLAPDGGDMVVLTPPPEPVVSVAFRNDTLAAAIVMLAEQYGVAIVLGRGVDPQSRLTGRLENQPLSVALALLLKASGYEARREGGVYVIENRNGIPVTEPASQESVANTPRAGAPAGWPAGVPWPPVDTPGLRFRVASPDGMPQVLVPAGEFQMGSPADEGDATEHPQRQVYVSAFWMDLHEVTNQQFEQFLLATGYPVDERKWGWSRSTGPRHPVSFVPWPYAVDYAQWAGRRLPTEAEWEKAARGGLEGARYPWGDHWDPAYAVLGDAKLPVCSRRPNRFGLFDLAGNVCEWCLDFYAPDWLERLPERDPANGDNTHAGSIRGGAFNSPVGDLRVARRAGCRPWVQAGSYGFRTVSPVDATPAIGDAPG